MSTTLWIDLDRHRETTLTQQLYTQISGRILAGELRAGERLPSSRQVAAELKIARNVVTGVFEQLQSEGYIETRPGSGTFVAALNVTPTPPAPHGSARLPTTEPAAQNKGRPGDIAFHCGIPDLAAFPRARWLQALRAVGFHAPAHIWSYVETAGLRELRELMARRLARVKGIACEPAQVVMTGGTAHALNLLGLFFAARMAQRGALVEDPVVRFVPEILRCCGHTITPVAVDNEGLVIDALPPRPRATLVFVSPAHQFPLGGTLPVPRRLALLAYARRHNLWVVEDDYDAEFRYQGVPVSSLARLDPERVIHLGTFSKVLAPSLRLGYMVLPRGLAEEVTHTLRPLHLTGSAVNQAALARLLAAGHLDRHVVRMRRLYQRKMRALCAELVTAFGERVRISGHTTGLHLVVRLAGLTVNAQVRAACEAAGVRFDTAADYAIRPRADNHRAILLGFGDLTVDQIRQAVRRLQSALRPFLNRGRRGGVGPV
ncbi:MAG TPA: PLP-dependent aminotransferase family protein [Methylomirabilota bacterium]|nr:PLP-dependent aminotransferase family protein [Methylomirabilota bacterium]